MMRSLPGADGQGAWDNSLGRDLSYIRKHLRYPATLKTIAPFIVWGLLAILLVSIVAVSLYSDGNKKGSFPVVIFAINVVTFSVMAVRYFQTLRFSAIPTGFYLQDNSVLLDKFLRSQQLLVFRHPELPEVYQILSRNLNGNANRDENREVIIFIADDKRILINSHFTGSNFFNSSGKRHLRQMATTLEDWIKKQPGNSTELVHKTL